MKITNLSNLSVEDFAELEKDLLKHKTLGKVLSWANAKPKGDFHPRIVAEVLRKMNLRTI